jgi:adenosylcobinamide-phosphate synthase
MVYGPPKCKGSSARRIIAVAMSFFAILFALLIEQARPLARTNPIHAGLRAWALSVSRNFRRGQNPPRLGGLELAVLVPRVGDWLAIHGR